MKARAVIVLDYDLSGDVMEAAEVKMKLLDAARALAAGDGRVEWFDADIRERRGESRPELKTAKFRTS
jgi:hypothetical protein